jgi:hypothetical protein
MNVDDLTVNGLGFSGTRPLKKRKFDLVTCIRELLEHKVIELGRGQADPKDLIFRRGKGCYVVSFYEGEYFRSQPAERTISQQNAIFDHPLFEPLRAIGVDQPAIRRLLKICSHGVIKRWVRITEAAMHEKPRGFAGFKVSPAAFLIDNIQNNRMPPDWFHAHERRQERMRWEREVIASAPDEQGMIRLAEEWGRESNDYLPCDSSDDL